MFENFLLCLAILVVLVVLFLFTILANAILENYVFVFIRRLTGRSHKKLSKDIAKQRLEKITRKED